ncbi:MAG TPA: tryptophan halogenase family protein [Sphingomicrobium sp.]|nr:tryptophan halogenase family protein [Sphingomicrobium sp.]
MERPIGKILIVGGGTAGWLSAAYLAARLPRVTSDPPSITLVEAPGIPTIGVGEGTWPTMRGTLATIGIGEAEFLLACDASFKQGSRFDGWVSGDLGDRYLHPFTPPPAADPRALVAASAGEDRPVSFADAMTAQARICAAGLAPRQPAMPDYEGALNYAYHLDATKLAGLLARHAVGRLGVRHVADEVLGTRRDRDGGIAAVVTKANGELDADLVIDCSGHSAILIGRELDSGWSDLGSSLLNDRAIALQLPVAADSPVASQTIGTAHRAGWLWDIGLPTRRGIGCVYSSAFMSDEEALAELAAYVERADPSADVSALSPRLLKFPTGHRREFWKGNCVAIGLSAGFIEPLEASAIVLIELSLQALADNWPASREAMPLHAERFNQLFAQRWSRIADFLKLHYALSCREEPYWRAQRDAATISGELRGLLRLWRDQPPSAYDFPLAQEMFPAASYQYVYYGMTGRPPAALRVPDEEGRLLLAQVRQKGRALAAALPTNRAYLDRLRAAPAPAAARETA